mmetsp:Transcript_10378/g.32153  ORF Transcript_10378/g.32153 Transcript_10378/m.32153 type:complete len:229 (-) Transcript_10378:169-855(-)
MVLDEPLQHPQRARLLADDQVDECRRQPPPRVYKCDVRHLARLLRRADRHGQRLSVRDRLHDEAREENRPAHGAPCLVRRVHHADGRRHGLQHRGLRRVVPPLAHGDLEVAVAQERDGRLEGHVLELRLLVDLLDDATADVVVVPARAVLELEVLEEVARGARHDGARLHHVHGARAHRHRAHPDPRVGVSGRLGKPRVVRRREREDVAVVPDDSEDLVAVGLRHRWG